MLRLHALCSLRILGRMVVLDMARHGRRQVTNPDQIQILHIIQLDMVSGTSLMNFSDLGVPQRDYRQPSTSYTPRHHAGAAGSGYPPMSWSSHAPPPIRAPFDVRGITAEGLCHCLALRSRLWRCCSALRARAGPGYRRPFNPADQTSHDYNRPGSGQGGFVPTSPSPSLAAPANQKQHKVSTDDFSVEELEEIVKQRRKRCF